MSDGTIYFCISQDTCLMQQPGVALGTYLATGGKRSEQAKLSTLKGGELLRRRVTGVLLFFFFFLKKRLLAAFTFPDGSGTGQRMTHGHR